MSSGLETERQVRAQEARDMKALVTSLFVGGLDLEIAASAGSWLGRCSPPGRSGSRQSRYCSVCPARREARKSHTGSNDTPVPAAWLKALSA